ELQSPTDSRLYAVVDALRLGMDIEKIYDLSRIDKWFLSKIREVTVCENEIREMAVGAHREDDSAFLVSALQKLDEATWRRWKTLGFGDEQIAGIILRERDGKRVGETRVIDASMAV